MPEQLLIEAVEDGHGLRVSGELDVLTVPQLRDALARLGDRSPDVVLEFGGAASSTAPASACSSRPRERRARYVRLRFDDYVLLAEEEARSEQPVEVMG